MFESGKGVHSLNRNRIQMKSNAGTYYIALMIAIVFVAINLRPSITAVGPLVSMIQDDMKLSHTMVGLLSSLPLIAFAVISPFVPSLVRAFHLKLTMLFGLIVLCAGIIIRLLHGSALLYTGTLLIGVGIAICNVLLPVVAKEKFLKNLGLVTSIYSTSLSIFAAIASGISVPLAVNFGFGWKGALFIWIIPVILGLIIWSYVMRLSGNEPVETVPVEQEQKKSYSRVWRSPLAWQISFFFGFQSSLFYITVNWLPDILTDKGIEIAVAGWLLSISQLVGLPASFIVPVLAGRYKSQSTLVTVIASLALIGYLGILFSETYLLILLFVCLLGISLSGSFALGLVFLGLRARTSEESTDLSGMVQSFGYAISAIGPILIGLLFDQTGSWTIPLITLSFISFLVILFGIGSGRDKYV